MRRGTNELLEARENAGNRVANGLSVASDRLKKRSEFQRN